MATDELAVGETGIASALRWWYFNSANQVYNSANGLFEAWSDGSYASYQVSGVTEIGTTGTYQVTTPAAVAGQATYRFEVHRVVGGTPSTDPLYGEGESEGTGVTAQTPVFLPATRLLTFEYETGTPPALTDVTGLPVLRDPTGLIGVRRTDTGATVIPASGVGYPVAMVRDSVGSYSYQVAENGYPLEYWVEYVVGGATRRQKFVSNPPLWHYATRGQLEVEYGKDDVTTYANLQSNDPATSLTADEVTAKIERALTFADDFINSRLRAYDYAIPLAALPGATLPTGLLNTIALCLAIWRLYRGRGKRDNDKVGDAFQEDYDWAVKELDSLLLAGLPAAQDTDADLETAQDAPVAVAATVDANGCNLDTTCNPCNRWPAVTVWR